MEQLKQIKVYIHSMWKDLKESTTHPVEKILMIVIVWSIIISSSLYGFISLNQKVTQLKERQENYVIKMHAESDYIVSKEAKLLESFMQNKVSNTSSNTSVFDSLQGEPLMIVSTDEHEGVLELTVLGSTERLINWINTVDEKEPSTPYRNRGHRTERQCSICTLCSETNYEVLTYKLFLVILIETDYRELVYSLSLFL